MPDEVERSQELLEKVQLNPEPEDVEDLRKLLDAEAAPARRNAVDGLRVLGKHDPSFLLREVDRLVLCLDDPDQEVRNSTVSSLAEAGRMDGSAIVDATPEIADLLTDSYQLVRHNAVEALLRAAQEDPSAAEPFVDDVIPFLDSDYDHVKEHAVFCLGAVSLECPKAIVPASDRLLKLFLDGLGNEVSEQVNPRNFDDSTLRGLLRNYQEESAGRHRKVRQAAGHAIYEIARVEPAVIVPSLSVIVEALDDKDPQVRAAAADVMFVLADNRPDAVGKHRDALAERLADHADFVSGPAVKAFAALSVERPDAVAEIAMEYVDAIIALLDHEDTPVRGAAASLLAIVAEQDPGAIDPATDRLEELRDAETEYVRQAATDALSWRT